jgi:hypothetical protein
VKAVHPIARVLTPFGASENGYDGWDSANITTTTIIDAKVLFLRA